MAGDWKFLGDDDSKTLEAVVIRTLALAAFVLAIAHVVIFMLKGEAIDWSGVGAFLAAAAVPYLSNSVRAGLRFFRTGQNG